MISKNSILNLSLILFLISFSFSHLYAQGVYDGKYNTAFDFKMSTSSVCPKTLPIEIEIVITDSKAEGYIFNNGGGNEHAFCKLYHNGPITGSVDSDGKVKFKIKQNDSHSIQYSSYKITGELEGRLKLYSRSTQYHPTHKFTLARVADSKQVTQNQTVEETTTKETTTSVNQNNNSDSSSNNTINIDNINSVEDAQTYINEIQATINMYLTINNVMKTNTKSKSEKEKYNDIINKKISSLIKQKELLQNKLKSRFSTPIKPTNTNLNVSAFRSAETFPKIPFYVPGTDEIGEMLVIPRVSDEGFLKYQLDFLDPTSEYDQVRDTISIFHENIDKIILGLKKVDEWTTVAQDNKVTRRVSKTAVCIPEGSCENKKQGVSSTEVVFQVYEDGSTSGKIQRNKGTFSVGYNLSVESSVLLSAYLIYMRDIGAQEFKIGSMSDEQVEELFN
tara:strand:+ start:148 stop:1491 length:1344 start_codon:yes stop_codon:yes gene_type:complete